MANLKAILRKHGYQPELSLDPKRFERELNKVIPAHRVAEYDALFESKIVGDDLTPEDKVELRKEAMRKKK